MSGSEEIRVGLCDRVQSQFSELYTETKKGRVGGLGKL